ncbi:MAG: glycosyltransferase family 4 protein, partial [Anaerolineae bacterium]|nr:glycosyltransferase family 4 protein [Anaerolineae bacterium]
PVVEMYREAGIETHVASGIIDFSHTALEWYGGRDLWRLPGKLLAFIPSIVRTRALLRRFRPDLVHLNSSPLAPCGIACKLEDVPVVWHIREPLARGYMGLRRWLYREIIDRCAQRIVAISHYDASLLKPSDAIRVIYNFVDFTTFDRSLDGSAVRVELGIPADAPAIAMLGGIAEPKGALVLVEALGRLIRRVPDVRVIIAGPPPAALGQPGIKGAIKRLLRVDAYQEAVQTAMAHLPEQARAALIFTGIRRDMPRVIAAANCVVFPSVVPHFARPLVEAAAMGKPGIGSRLGGPEELIVDGQTGLLVPPGDPDALSQALADVLAKPEQAAQMGETAYRRALILFEAALNAQATIALYDEVLTGSSD